MKTPRRKDPKRTRTSYKRSGMKDPLSHEDLDTIDYHWPIYVVMNVRATSFFDAWQIAQNTLDTMSRVDTGDPGHIAGGYVLNQDTHPVITKED